MNLLSSCLVLSSSLSSSLLSLHDLTRDSPNTSEITGYETVVMRLRRQPLSPRRRRTLRRRGLLHSPHAATACSTVNTLSMNSAEQGSFPHCLDTDVGLRDLDEFLNDPAVGDASQPRPAPGNHARPAKTGTFFSLLFLSVSVFFLSLCLCLRVMLCCVVCGSACGVCGSDDSDHAVSVQARSYVQLIGWQNTWEQAPGVPATPSPP